MFSGFSQLAFKHINDYTKSIQLLKNINEIT